MMGIMTTTVDSSDSMPERLQEGSAAPDFTLSAVIPGFTENGLINLSDVLDAGRRVVLYFYPAAMTPGCTTEACDFRDNLDRAQVVRRIRRKEALRQGACRRDSFDARHQS